MFQEVAQSHKVSSRRQRFKSRHSGSSVHPLKSSPNLTINNKKVCALKKNKAQYVGQRVMKKGWSEKASLIFIFIGRCKFLHLWSSTQLVSIKVEVRHTSVKWSWCQTQPHFRNFALEGTQVKSDPNLLLWSSKGIEVVPVAPHEGVWG